MEDMMPHTIIAPSGTVTDVRDAGGDTLGSGRDLSGGGVAWDLALDDALRSELEAAGAEVYERREGKYLSDVVERAGYSLQEPDIS